MSEYIDASKAISDIEDIFDEYENSSKKPDEVQDFKNSFNNILREIDPGVAAGQQTILWAGSVQVNSHSNNTARAQK